MSGNPSNEQPVTKRQRIDSQRSATHNISAVDDTLNSNENIPPDIEDESSTNIINNSNLNNIGGISSNNSNNNDNSNKVVNNK